MFINLLFLIGGLGCLVLGSNWFVEGASSLARRMGISQLVIGLTIVAMGTSIPEVAVSVTAAANGNAAIAIGNVVGSNTLNILLILGITALIRSVAVGKTTMRYEIPFMLLATSALLIMGMTGDAISFAEGIILLALFIAYLGYLYVIAKEGDQPNQIEEGQNISLVKCILMIVIGCALVILGSDFAVEGAINIAKEIGLSERFIGLTVVALGTSLPELVTSITAALKGNSGIVIGNIVGSNIFNILFILGTSAILGDIPFEKGFIFDTAMAIVAGLALWLGTAKGKKLSWPQGITMIVIYSVYVWILS